MPEDLDLARAEAVQEMASAAVASAGRVLARHGNDPDAVVIVAAGFAMALQSIGRGIDARIPQIAIEMLKEQQP